MPLEEVNGLKLHTQTIGTSGPWAVMIHGMILGSLSTWFFSVGPGVATDMQVLLYDLRGHGLSEQPPTGYGVPNMVEDLECLTRLHGLERFTIVGHSFGAVVAMRFAVTHPELVERLVLIEPTLPLTSPVWLDSLATSSWATILDLFPPLQRDILIQGGRRADRLLANVKALGRKTTLIEDVMAFPDITDEELASIRCPVLLCHGVEAEEFTGETRERLMATLPDVTLRLFDTGHNVPLEAPDLLTAEIRAFLANHPVPPPRESAPTSGQA